MRCMVTHDRGIAYAAPKHHITSSLLKHHPNIQINLNKGKIRICVNSEVLRTALPSTLCGCEGAQCSQGRGRQRTKASHS